jgi:hypothetical protein
MSSTSRADHRGTPGGATATPAEGANRHPGNFDFLLRAERCFLQGDFQVVTKVCPLGFLNSGAHGPEEVCQNFLEEIIKKIVPEGEILRFSEPAEPSGPHESTPAVVGGALLSILQDLVGFGDSFKVFFRSWIPGVFVGMKLMSETAVGFLNLLPVGQGINAQEVVKISLEH